MIKKGYQLTCSGCGADTFVESNVSPRPLNLKYGTHVTAHNEEQSESWVAVHQLFDLCPRCAKIHEEMLSKFYEECGRARDNEESNAVQ